MLVCFVQCVHVIYRYHAAWAWWSHARCRAAAAHSLLLHRPIKAISMLSELTRQLDINQFQALQMQENVQFFYDALGGCERLLRTPIPVSYTR